MLVDVNQTKYGQIKAVSFTIDQGNTGCKRMIQKWNQKIMKESLLLLKDLLEPERTKLINNDFNIEKFIY